jgi:hypothetical protein
MVSFDQKTPELPATSLMETQVPVTDFDHKLARLVRETERRAIRFERREDERQPFPYLVQLIPIPLDAGFNAQERLNVIGHDISRGGFRFYHTQPLPLRRVIVTLPWTNTEGLLLQLRWCRFLQQGWYESGGCFIGTTPIALPTT